MPDRRVPRGSKVIDTPGSEGSIAPMNSGGTDQKPIREEMEERLEEQKRIETIKGEGTGRRMENPKNGSGGFGVKPLDALNQSGARSDKGMAGLDKFLTLSYVDMIAFIQGGSALSELVDYLRSKDDVMCNPPTPDEFAGMLSFAIRRSDSGVSSEKSPTVEEMAGSRQNMSLESKKEYADPTRMAFPVDTLDRVKSAHAYVHKYWGNPAKKGVTAFYDREDFIKVHRQIMSAMQEYGLTHQYLDSLDDASGVNKEGASEAQPKAEAQKPVKLSFDLRVGQKVVSISRDRMREVGVIAEVDGMVGKVEWEAGLQTTEWLASLIPYI